MVIKTLTQQNPFADYGNVVQGKRFIGRKEAIQKIQERVLGDIFGNLAVVGLPRIGKTSLVHHTLMPVKAALAQQQHYLVFITVSTLSYPNDFFKALIRAVLTEMQFGNDPSYPVFALLYEEVKQHQKDRFEFTNSIIKFFKFLKRKGLRVTYVLDEFDHAEKIFSLENFQLLRELSSQQELQICLITISRRTIQEIEAENGAISNFFGIFYDLPLQQFDKEDLNVYWKRIEGLNITVSEAYKKEVYFFVGAHPYWMDMVKK
jgi:AAA+ ATPase superfamily predicted ATPase